MRKISLNYEVFKYDELSDEAKQRVKNDLYQFGFYWNEEISKSYECLARHCNCKIKYDSYDGITYKVCLSLECENDLDIENMANKRVIKYIYNNFISPVLRPNFRHYEKGAKGRKSNIQYPAADISCLFDLPFTGYCEDYVLIESFQIFIKKFNKCSNMSEFIEIMGDVMSNNWTKENEYQMSDEYVYETVSDVEFLKDGTRLDEFNRFAI